MGNMLKRLLLAGLSLVGFQAQQARAVSHPNEVAQRQSVLKNGASAKEIEEDHLGGYVGGIKRQWMREGGRTPYEFGISRECAQMRRKNSMRAKGIRGAAI